MAEKTTIGWTDATWNPHQGCRKVSEGCKFCYMYRDKEMHKQDPKRVHRSSDATFYAPLRKKAFKEPMRVFTCSWSDFFIEEADAWRDELWAIIKQTPHLTYQILTKRIERVADHLPNDWGDGYDNVWLGVTVENQDAVSRIGVLEEIPAKIKFISFEPLIGPLTSGFVGEVDWIIIGGESGNDNGKYRYRPCEQEWIQTIIGAYEWANREVQSERYTHIFVKQLGTHLSKHLGLKSRHGIHASEWPDHLQIQDFPV
ncbi:DUF5131 family protein [Spirosoma aerolatum]|uniref:DUF5131 family protein n=1 Tax=Spirosoma aerolatum TaxID=1211326 RepID=UPI0014726DDF|nr:DUF5131 family protein [Spirosoma aerolatum]